MAGLDPAIHPQKFAAPGKAPIRRGIGEAVSFSADIRRKRETGCPCPLARDLR
jgi:hypothetical protein